MIHSNKDRKDGKDEGTPQNREDREDSERVRRILMGHNIGDWVQARNFQNQIMAGGKIIDVNVRDGIVIIDSPIRYVMTPDGYKNKKGVIRQSVHTPAITNYIDYPEDSVWGSLEYYPAVENLGKSVRLSYKGSDYLGRVSRVFPRHVVLNPFIDSILKRDGRSRYCLSPHDLWVPVEDLTDVIVKPLAEKSLEDTVRLLNRASRSRSKQG